MGKSLPSTTRLHDFARATTQRFSSPRRAKPISKLANLDQIKLPLKKIKMDNKNQQESSSEVRLPLSFVVSDCVGRWFQDTLKQAKDGDVSMQVLVGQMYYTGYGIPKDDSKGRAWIAKASKSRSSVLKFGDKRPGYGASDSDSEELEEDKNNAK
ncbi:hypothetical protein Syun_000146 [Stephania yunnanensis]|uniref:Uncharacterized protein n=1 Tax=Stephania yunnanensis TaxID=152371 RepID=A0AAP0LBL8_9MAGN